MSPNSNKFLKYITKMCTYLLYKFGCVYTNINLKNAYVQQFDKRYLKHPIKYFRNVFFHPKRFFASRQIKSNQKYKKKNSCSTFLKRLYITMRMEL